MPRKYQRRPGSKSPGAPKGTVPWNKDRTRIVTWGAAISAATKGKPKSEKHKQAIGVALRGHILSADTKKKISEAHKRLNKSSWSKGLRKATNPNLVTWGVQGEAHWAWKGGISSEINLFRQTSEYKVWRDKVFQRDQYRCQWCNKQSNELEAHHLIQLHVLWGVPWAKEEFLLDPINGLTLCKSCHRELHADKKTVGEIASELIKEMGNEYAN